MTTLANLWIPFMVITTLTHQCRNSREGDGSTWICSHERWSLTSLAMEVKASQMVSWVAMHSSLSKCWRRCIPMKFIGLSFPKVTQMLPNFKNVFTWHTFVSKASWKKVKTHYGDPLLGVTLYYFPRVCMFECIPFQIFERISQYFNILC
jgi:hypothetical protein